MTTSDSNAATPVTDQVWRDYNEALYGFIQRRVSDSSRAEDILQDVFVKIHERIGTLQDSGRVQSWVYQITRNAVIDHYRSHRATEELPDDLTAPEIDASDEVHRELSGCMLPFIEALPDQYREALTLSEIEGLPQKEVARRQGLSLSGAKSRIQRGRQLMKRQLTDCCNIAFDRDGSIVDVAAKGGACGKCEE